MRKFYAHRSFVHRSCDIAIFDGEHIMKPVDGVFVLHNPHELTEPSLRLRDEDGQSLIDALIEAGYRPSREPPAEPTIAALKSHIAFAESMANALLKGRK